MASDSTATPKPFRIDIPQADIDDLKQRIANTRWPKEQVNDDAWSYGMEQNYLKQLTDYWANEYDWRSFEARLNQFDQFTLEIDGLSTHFIHQRSSHENATPLIISHGWPGSIVEFIDVIDRLAEPQKYGGDPANACHVVAPSLPGYGFSEAAKAPGMNTATIAGRHVKLMAALGYDRYIAQGGDWGSIISGHTAGQDQEHCIGLHQNLMITMPPEGEEADLASMINTQDTGEVNNAVNYTATGQGYFQIQSTKPQTLGYGLNDSPVGLCAWIGEKFHGWTDHNGEIRDAMTWDLMLTNISLYWFTGTITSSTRLYLEDTRNFALPAAHRIPTGFGHYPGEVMHPVREWAEAAYNIVQWTEAEKGGHFAALEQPEAFAADLLNFVAKVRP